MISLIIGELVNHEYRSYTNKRLTTVMSTVKSLSHIHCVTLCSNTDGCQAVNILHNNDIICELSRGLSNQNQMMEDPASNLYVMGQYSLP